MAWRARWGGFASELQPEPELAHLLAAFGAPVIKPSGQAHLYENKLHNLRLAAATFEGLVLRPRQVFSFWERVGAPIAERGYRDGPSFLGLRVTSSVGGGLCQLSGVLYNLALLGGLAILERHPHSIDAYGPGRYLPLGRDATVAHGIKDLCFANPYPFEIAMAVEIRPDRVDTRLRGARPLPLIASIEVDDRGELLGPREVILDRSLAPGEEVVEAGLVGREVVARRILRFDTGEVRTERLSRDLYHPTPTRVRLGPVSPPAPRGGTPESRPEGAAPLPSAGESSPGPA